MRHVRSTVTLAAIMLLASCDGAPAARDKNDATPPVITLSVTASSNTPDGTEVVAPGSSVVLNGSGGTALITAADDKGVGWVEVWMTQTEHCSGVVRGPGLAGSPTRHVDGAVTDTSAPSTLVAGFDINLLTLRRGCNYTFEVWGKAANAATNPVDATSSVASLKFSPT